MNRAMQILLIAMTLVVSWLAMQIVHELGHVIGAVLSGGRVGAVVLYPTTISYTRIVENPHPLLVAWMGPLVGVLLPLVALVVARTVRSPVWYLIQFFAGFCFIANGAYIAFGSINSIGDAGDLLRHGASPLLIWLFGLTTIIAGFIAWHGLGPHFGLGREPRETSARHAFVLLAVLVAIIGFEIVLGRINQ